MVDRFPNGFDAEVKRVNEASDRALYKYLRVHICGPYVNDSHAFLSEVKYRLQEPDPENKANFVRAKLCTDRNETLPDHLDVKSPTRSQQQAIREFWTDVSYSFLRNADVAIFFFLDPTINRSNLPERAFEDTNDPDLNHLHGQNTRDLPQDANGSVVEELNYWLREMEMSPARTLVLFEESNYEKTSSLVSGRVGLNDCFDHIFDTNDIDSVVDFVQSRCVNWAMNQCKRRLQDQYYEDLWDDDDEDMQDDDDE